MTFQIQTRRMSHFNEGEKAKEERRKYQKTAQVLTLFIVSYVAQYLPWIIFCIWSFFVPPPSFMVSQQWHKPLKNKKGFSGGFRGGAPGARPPHGPKFSQFHVVFRKIWQNHMLAPPWRVGAPSYGESWISPWASSR